MIRVTVEHVDGITGTISKIGIMEIRTNANYAKSHADYTGQAYFSYPQTFGISDSEKITKSGKVKNWPRRSPKFWNLVLRMLKDMFPEER